MMNNIVPSVYILLTVMCASVESGCLFQGVVHSVGDTWHPASFGTCVNCTCEINERGESDVRCINTADKCPKLTCATQKRDPNSCCPYCEVSADEDESSSYKRANCTASGGRIYKDGERYASNSTGLVPNSDKQCVMCICEDGRSLCYLKTCIVPKTCSKFLQRDGDCCPVCADCLDTSGIKMNGSQWHPTIESIGEIDCITCTCLNGEIKCKKDCIPDHELPCRHPKKPNGECCRTCPEQGESTEKKKKKNRKDRKNRKDKNDRKRRKGRKGKKRRRKCKEADKDTRRCRNRRRRRKERTTTQTVKPTASAGISLDNLCIKKKTAYLVYKAISDTKMLIAFDDIESNAVYVHTWTVNKEHQRGVVTYKESEMVPSPEFRRKINNTNVVGTAGKSQYRKFKRRLKDKLEKCSEECAPELFIKIMQRVKVHLLKFGDKC